MGDIEEYIQKKKSPKKYNFKVTSTDGVHEIHYDNLDKFSKEWFSGKLPTFDTERMITGFGDVVSPLDSSTRDALKLYAIKSMALESLNSMGDSEKIMELALGINRDGVAELIAIKHLGLAKQYLETEIGRVFLVKEEDDNHKYVVHSDAHIERIGLPRGSMSLQDTVTIYDELQKHSLIVDTRNEAVEIEDVLSRSLSKSQVLLIQDNYTDESRIDDGIVKEIKVLDQSVIGNTEKLNVIYDQIVDMKNLDSNSYGGGFNIVKGGFSNSMENPATGYDVSWVISKIKPEEVILKPKGLNKEDSVKQAFDAIKISNTFSHALGSPEKGFYIANDEGKVDFISNGDYMKNDYTNTSPLKSNLKLVGKDEMKALDIVKGGEKLKYSPF